MMFRRVPSGSWVRGCAPPALASFVFVTIDPIPHPPAIGRLTKLTSSYIVLGRDGHLPGCPAQ